MAQIISLSTKCILHFSKQQKSASLKMDLKKIEDDLRTVTKSLTGTTEQEDKGPVLSQVKIQEIRKILQQCIRQVGYLESFYDWIIEYNYSIIFR